MVTKGMVTMVTMGTVTKGMVQWSTEWLIQNEDEAEGRFLADPSVDHWDVYYGEWRFLQWISFLWSMGLATACYGE